MDRLANKIRKAEDLDNMDLRVWVGYNFLAFPKPDQDKIKALNER